MQRKFSFSVDESYHIYNRGTDKRKIFLDKEDEDRFVALLYLCNSEKPMDFRRINEGEINEGESFVYDRGESIVDIGAYCLMSNHFHLLIHEKEEGGITKFMTKLSTAYSMYFNKNNERTGSLFEGCFKAKHVDSDEYLKYLFAYIHLNPVKMIDAEWKENGIKDRVAAKKYLQEYAYSSYLDYVGNKRKEGNILEQTAFPDYFSEVKDFEEFITEWLMLKS